MGRYVTMFKGMPRAMRWGILAVVGIALYFLAIEPAVDQINAWGNEADLHQTTLESFNTQGGTQQKAIQALSLGQRHYGDVEFLGDEATRTVQFNSAVDSVLKSNNIPNAKNRWKNAPLGQGVLAAKMGTETRIERVTRDIEFDATPEAVAAVVAELERTPVVASVSRVTVRMNEGSEGRQVHAVVTAEAWISSKKGQG